MLSVYAVRDEEEPRFIGKRETLQAVETFIDDLDEQEQWPEGFDAIVVDPETLICQTWDGAAEWVETLLLEYPLHPERVRADAGSAS